MPEQSPEYVFDQVQIGKGLRPLAQHGFIIIDRGVLSLLGSDRQVIDSGPIDKLKASKIRFTGGKSVSLILNGTKYNVSPGWGAHLGSIQLPGSAQDVKSAADALLHLIASGGGATG